MNTKPAIEQQWAELHRLQRRQFWTGALETVACAVLGLLAGFAFALGYLADMSR
jgi:ABC-type phosphate/phosphonate transport system permease subunit